MTRRWRIPFLSPRESIPIDGAVERYRRNRLTKPMIGIHVRPDFESIVGAVCGFQGAGKWIRTGLNCWRSQSLPASLREACCEAVRAETRWQDLIGAGFDLGEACADLCESLLGDASMSLDDILAVCIDEPGIRWRDYDGRLEYVPLFQPQRFVERTGLNVIDGLAAADIAGGGQGGPLAPLAVWFLLADRAQPIARAVRWLVSVDDQTTIIRLPPSDGLDADLPAIQVACLPGLALVDRLMRRSQSSFEEDESLAALAVQGKSIDEVRDELATDIPAHSGNWESWESLNPGIDQWINDRVEQLERQSARHGWPWPDVWYSVVRAQIDQIQGALNSLGWEESGPNELIIAGRGVRNGLILQELRRMNEATVTEIEELGIQTDAFPAVIAAMLGMMHVDQLPASLPWLTGSLIPRLHGRVAAGRPVNWRRLLIEMADYHPPAMKLRDAV